MTTDTKKHIPLMMAKVISVIFHPLFMPVYGILIIFSAPTLFGYLPFNVKKLLFLIILINNVFLPFSLLPFFRYRNIITTWSIEKRGERVIPLLTITILYLATAYIIFRFPIPSFLKSFVFASFFLSLIVTVVNFWWKISVHAVGAGALTALVLILSMKMYTPLTGYLILVIISTGLVLSSRLRLNVHNPQQVWIGLLSGFLGLGLYIWFF
jgi:hypothetical protein